mmetsp:Transcript_69976/g.145872  ORF Transcript_69976/g.145872 Transcript_69976/m.145872 type:complete len:244 (+) Transcript_69976:293-1024(+)
MIAGASPGGPLQQFEDVRKRARRLEADIDGKLVAYNRVSVSQGAKGGTESDVESGEQTGDSFTTSLASELESLLAQLSETHQDMGRCVKDLAAGEGARQSHVLQRHRELLHEYEKEFRKIKANIKEQRERDDLLHSVRKDIGEYKSAASARTDPLLRERGAATNSIKTADQVLESAQTTFDALRNQRQLYSSIGSKLSAFRARLPTIDSLVGRIQRRKKFESIVLAIVLATCAIVVLYFSILR